MHTKHTFIILAISLFAAFPPLLLSQDNTPHFGNGMRNSWVDQTSIVIWTRTTKNPEMVSDGPNFKEVSNKLAKEIKQSGDDSRYLTSQLADNHQLDQMLGACPGMAGQVQLAYRPTDGSEDERKTAWIGTSKESDFTAQWKLTDLKPDTHYTVVAHCVPQGGSSQTRRLEGKFKTAPKKSESKNFKFCVTTCHDFLRRDDGLKGHKIYDPMTAIKPDFVVHAGDIEYYDKAKPYAWTKELMRFKWQRLFAMPRNRQFYSNHSTYFIKDDHDTLSNDSWPGRTYGNVKFAEGVKLFNEEQFPSHKTRYETISWGKDVQFWILEGRDYRSANNADDGPEKTILGAEQKAWLKSTLSESKSKFKLVFSPTPIVGPDRKNKSDNHANAVFAHEGKELREFFGSLEGLIVFCGDRHWQYASVDAENGVWEFGCGPGSEKHQIGWKKGDVRPVHKFLRVAGGFISGEVIVTNEEPKLVLRHHSVNGNEKSKFEFPVVRK